MYKVEVYRIRVNIRGKQNLQNKYADIIVLDTCYSKFMNPIKFRNAVLSYLI